MKNTLRILKILFYVVFALIGIIAIAYMLIMRYQGSIATQYLKSIAAQYHCTLSIDSLDIDSKSHHLILRNVSLHHPEQKKPMISIETIDVDLGIEKLFTTLSLQINFNAEGLSLSQKNSHMNFDHLSIAYVQNAWFDNDTTLDLECKSGKDVFLTISTSILRNRAKLIIGAQNLPVDTYKYLNIFIKNNTVNDVFAFLRQYIQSGQIQSGHLNADLLLDNNNTLNLAHDTENPTTISGKFEISNIDFWYDEGLPMVKDLNTTLDITGSKLSFNISSKAQELEINNGAVDLDWGTPGPMEVIVKLSAKSSAKYLTNFIKNSTIKTLNDNYHLDLASIAGTALTNLKIIISTSANVANIYDIQSTISDATLNIPHYDITALAPNLQATFDSNKIAVFGNCKFNNYNGKINYIYNLKHQDNASNIESMLNIDADIVPSNYLANIFGDIIAIHKGIAPINIKYTSTFDNKHNNLAINCDVTKVDLDIPYLQLTKKIHAPGFIVITPVLDGDNTQQYLLEFTAPNNFKINGLVQYNDRIQSCNLNVTKDNYNGKIKLLNKSSKIECDINAKFLDLSKIDILQTLNSSKQSRKTIDIKCKADRVKLKNNVVLNDVAGIAHLGTKSEQNSGSLSSKIGSRDFDIAISQDDPDVLIVNTSNAGAILYGLDLYSKIGAGDLELRYNTKSKTGHFTMSKFIMMQDSIIMQILSYASLQGLISLIRSTSSNYTFVDMTGDLIVQENLIEFKNCKANSAYFDLTLNCEINQVTRHVILFGTVTPSLYGINRITKYIPLVRDIFAKLSPNGNQGLVFAPYSIQYKY